jgi:hypothetical protein
MERLRPRSRPFFFQLSLSTLPYLPRQFAPGRVRRDLGQEFDVILGVDLGQLGGVGPAGALWEGGEREKK